MACYSLIKKENFLKLDKIDKIGISLIFILFTLFSVFSCFSYASEYVDILVLDDVRINSSDVITTATSSSHKLYYFPIEKGYKYSFTLKNLGNNNLNLRTGFVDVVEIGQVVNSAQHLTVVDTYNIIINANNYDENFYVSFPYPEELVEVTCVKFPLQSMSNSVYALVQNVGISGFWNVFEISVPWVLVVVLFVFGFWFFSHWVKEISKGREF